MAIFKKSIIILLCMILAFSPLLYCGDFSYAENTPADWTQVYPDDEDLIAQGALLALRAMSFMYKSSPAGVATKWTYEELRRRCDACGITMEELSQYMQYKVEGNKYSFFYRSGIAALLNQLWSDMMTTYGLQANSFQVVYSGKYYTDGNGNHIICFVTQPDKNTSYMINRLDFYDYYQAFGSKWLHDGKDYLQLNSVTWNEPGYGDFTYNVLKNVTGTNSGQYQSFISLKQNSAPVYAYDGCYHQGYDCIVYETKTQTYGICTFLDYNRLNQDGTLDQRTIKIQYLANLGTSQNNAGNASVEAHQGEPKSLPTNQDFKITEPDDDEDDPVVETGTPNPPPTDPYVPNPTGGGSTDDGNGNTDFHWQMPDINVDWDLGDFSNIFPFSIPFDIIELFDIVDSEPVTPAIYQEVDFGAFNYTIDFDLSYFDEFMEYVRAMELFLYTLTLFIATRGIFKIY